MRCQGVTQTGASWGHIAWAASSCRRVRDSAGRYPRFAIVWCCVLIWSGLGTVCLGLESAEPARPKLFGPPPVRLARKDVAALPPTDKSTEKPATAAMEFTKTEERDAKADEQEGRADDKKESPSPSPPKPELLPELSPEMAALRDRVRRTLAADFGRPPSTGESTPTEIIHHCLVFGCDATVRNGADRDRPINAVGCLAWNYSCAGYRLMLSDGGRMMARVGYGLQQRPGQFLAVLAQSGVPGDYEIRVGDDHGTVADLVEHEKLDCRDGSDLSAKLIGLSFYLDPDQTWKNQLGQTWSLQRIVEEELDRQVEGGTAELTDQLKGLGYAVRWRLQKKLPLEGQYARASDYITKFHEYALELQNPDGSWHPRIFVLKGTSNDQLGLLRSNGRILEWLALSFPKDRLDDPQLVSSVAYVTGLLNSRNSRRASASITTADMVDRMHALRALSIYDQRYFKPRDRKEPAPDTEAGNGVARL